MGLAALEKGSPEARFAGLRRDAGQQESRALGALVFDCRRRPTDDLAVDFSSPIAAVRIRWRGVGRVSQPPLRSDAVRPDAVQQFRHRPEVLAPALPYHDSEHRPPSKPRLALGAQFRSSRNTFFQLRRSSIGDTLLEQVGHCVLPADTDVLLRKEALGGVEVVRFEVAEHLVPCAEDRVVANPCAS